MPTAKKASAPAKAKNRALAKRGTTAIATNDALSLLQANAGAGLEDIRSEHLAMPFLSILQDGSPQVKKRDPKYIPGAEAGMFLYSTTNKVFESIRCVMFHFDSNVVEWFDRKLGKTGFVAQYPDMHTATAARTAANRQDTQLQNTHNHYLLIEDAEEGEWIPCVFPATSTKLSPSKKWLNAVRTLRLPESDAPCPIFGGVWILTPEFQQKDSNSYFTFSAELEGIVDDPDLVAKAVEYAKGYASGKVVTQYERSADAEDEDEVESM